MLREMKGPSAWSRAIALDKSRMGDYREVSNTSRNEAIFKWGVRTTTLVNLEALYVVAYTPGAGANAEGSGLSGRVHRTPGPVSRH